MAASTGPSIAPAGSEIKDETKRRYPQGCPTGSAVVSGAGKLPARFVIHTVGPVYSDGNHGEPELLASAYRHSLELATDNHCQSVAFPSLSTGAYHYPMAEAAKDRPTHRHRSPLQQPRRTQPDPLRPVRPDGLQHFQQSAGRIDAVAGRNRKQGNERLCR